MLSIPPSAAPIISNGASTPPEVPEPSEIIQIADFTSSTPAKMRQRHIALQQHRRSCRSRRRAPAEKSVRPIPRTLRRSPATTSNESAAFEKVFGRINSERQQSRKRARREPGNHAAAKSRRPDERRMRGHRKQRPQPEKVAPRRACRGAGKRHRNRAARLPFKQQQLDARSAPRQRSRECRRHAGRRSRHQQRPALRAGEMEELARSSIRTLRRS